MSFNSEFVIRRTSRRANFLSKINALLDWKKLSAIIHKHYSKGHSKEGRPSYDGLLLFKMCLLQTWYSLSDYQVEDYVNENLSAMMFCGLELEDEVPDHSVISRFRSELSKKG
ncbi:MAG: transposase [Bacteroidia bacterium]|nr:transposase [Bacteroidia bacterium]